MREFEKDFDAWNSVQKHLERKESVPYFKEREIWYCRVGCNVGNEQDGKGKDFRRPVLIIRKFNKDLFIGIPLTTKIKSNPFYLDAGFIKGTYSMFILTQIRVFSSKRLMDKICTFPKIKFLQTKKAAQKQIFGS